MDDDLLARRQQYQDSCGAAAVTVPLAELHAEPNTDEAEERVWRRVRGMTKYGQSLGGWPSLHDEITG